MRGRYKSSLEIRDKDIEAQLQQKPEKVKNDVGYEYIMRPVVFIVPRGSPEAAYDTRKRDAEALRARFQNCNDGITFARALEDVAVRDQVSKYSADLAQQLREILDSTAVGHLTPPETTAEGVQMFAICAKRETKSDTPEMHEIRDQMLQQRFGAQAKRYLERFAARGDDRIQDAGRQIDGRNEIVQSLALTIGEPAGIGPDLTLAVWHRRAELDIPSFYIVADPDFLRRRAQSAGPQCSDSNGDANGGRGGVSLGIAGRSA